MWISNAHQYDPERLAPLTREMLRPETVTITTTSNTSDPDPAFVPYFYVAAEAPVPIDNFEPSRIRAFEQRGFHARFAMDVPEKLFSLFIRNQSLGQGFIFYFNSHAELMQWCSSHPTVKPKRIIRRFYAAEGLAHEREDEMEVKASEHVNSMLDRLIARKYKPFGELPPLAEEKSQELKFERQVELDIP